MANVLQAAPPTTRVSGRMFFWLGLGLCLLGPIMNVIQIQLLKQLTMPWYALAMGTLGAALLLYAVYQRPRFLRILFLGLFGLLAAFEWFFVVTLTKLP